jgi:hypothetical protein
MGRRHAEEMERYQAELDERLAALQQDEKGAAE